MRYQVTHDTHYHYSQAVRLRPHTLRLCPRNDGIQWLRKFDMVVSPTPAQQRYWLDANGNTCLQVTFAEAIESLKITTISEVETTRENPFDYLVTPWALQLPVDYPSAIALQLQPYLEWPVGWGIDEAMSPEVLDVARQLKRENNSNVGTFLTSLTRVFNSRTVCLSTALRRRPISSSRNAGQARWHLSGLHRSVRRSLSGRGLSCPVCKRISGRRLGWRRAA